MEREPTGPVGSVAEVVSGLQEKDLIGIGTHHKEVETTLPIDISKIPQLRKILTDALATPGFQGNVYTTSFKPKHPILGTSARVRTYVSETTERTEFTVKHELTENKGIKSCIESDFPVKTGKSLQVSRELRDQGFTDKTKADKKRFEYLCVFQDSNVKIEIDTVEGTNGENEKYEIEIEGQTSEIVKAFMESALGIRLMEVVYPKEKSVEKEVSKIEGERRLAG